MKKKSMIVSLLGVVSISAVALAGVRAEGLLRIVDHETSIAVAGGLGSVRNAPAANNLGCSVSVFGGFPSVECFAFEGERSVSCFSDDPALIAVASGLSDSSHLRFAVDRETGECQWLQVTSAASFAPKAI